MSAKASRSPRARTKTARAPAAAQQAKPRKGSAAPRALGRAALIEQMRREQEAEAAEAWKALSAITQQRLAWEVAATRAHELRRAYPALLAIGAGFRVRNEQLRPHARRAAGRQPRSRGELSEEPVVIFTVARKWKPRTQTRRAPRPGELPGCLLAYADAPRKRGQRVLVAVPTDVRNHGRRVRVAVPADERKRGAVRAQPLQEMRGTIAARSEGLQGQVGILTCAVRLPGKPSLFAMGAHHVLAMSLETAPPGMPVDHADIVLRDTDTRIGRLVADPIGSLAPGRLAMDAALAQVEDGTATKTLRDATAGMRAKDFWRDPGAFPTRCRVLVGSPEGYLPARFVQRRIVFGDDSGEVVYFGGTGIEPLHPVMLELWIDESAARSTEPGESGCPVVTDDGSRLVGMHIGGVVESRTIWAIPATELFLASRWKLPSPPALVPL